MHQTYVTAAQTQKQTTRQSAAVDAYFLTPTPDMQYKSQHFPSYGIHVTTSLQWNQWSAENDLCQLQSQSFNFILILNFTNDQSDVFHFCSVSIKITTVKSKYIFILLINLAGNLIVLKRMVTILNIKFQQS